MHACMVRSALYAQITTETIGVRAGRGGQVPLSDTNGITSSALNILTPSQSDDAGTGTGGATTPAAPVPNATATASSCPGELCVNSMMTGRASARLCIDTTKSWSSSASSAETSA